MKDRVGQSVPANEQLETARSKLAESREILSPFTVSLTNEERSRATKMQPGGDRVVDLITRLASKYRVSLPGVSVEGVRSDLALAQQLTPLAAAVDLYGQALDDTILEARSECWWATMAYYTILVRISDTDPELANALKPAIEYFSRRKTKKAEPKEG
jgi:hypothetical protein